MTENRFHSLAAQINLTQNVLILAYEKPVTETELAKALGTPTAFIEPIIEKMIAGELMKRTDSGKVYTDFIIYTEKTEKQHSPISLNLYQRNLIYSGIKQKKLSTP